jgi:hypothetical protein
MQAQKLYKLSEQELGQQIVNNGTSQEHKLLCAALLMRFKLRTSRFTDALASIAGLKDDKALQDILTSTFNKYKTSKNIKLDLQAWDGLMQSNPHWFKRFLEILVLVITLSFYNAKAKRLENGFDKFLFEAYTSAPQEKIQELTQELIRDIRLDNLSSVSGGISADTKLSADGQYYVKDYSRIKKIGFFGFLKITRQIPKLSNKTYDDIKEAVQNVPNLASANEYLRKNWLHSKIQDIAQNEVLNGKFVELFISKLDPNHEDYLTTQYFLGKDNKVLSASLDNAITVEDLNTKHSITADQSLKLFKLQMIAILSGNTDMHTGNILFRHNKLIPIDFNLSYVNFPKCNFIVQNNFKKLDTLKLFIQYYIYLCQNSLHPSEKAYKEIQSIIKTFNENKVTLFQELGAAAQALKIPQSEVQKTFETISSNFALLQKLFTLDNLQKIENKVQKGGDTEQTIQEFHKIWMDSINITRKKQGNNIRSR